MKHVYLVRHGETTHNRDQLVQDGTTVLSDTGIKQANVVAERLTNLNFSHLVVSDFERTKQTADPISRLSNLKPIYTPLFREVIRPSEFHHTPRSADVYQEFLRKEAEMYARDTDWKYSDEHSFAEVQTRVGDALAFVQKLEGDVVVVTHGHFIRRIVASVVTSMELDGATWQKMHQSFRAVNTSITVIVYDEDLGRWRLLTFNDHAHFAE